MIRRCVPIESRPAAPVEVLVSSLPRMTLLDRCDGCGAAAYVAVRLRSGGLLLFCGHHYRTHALALVEYVREIRDERYRLEEDRLTEATPHDDERTLT